MKTTHCPIPLHRVADNCGELIAAHDWDDYQAEYGIDFDVWLRDHESLAQDIVNRWWDQLPGIEQREWIARYRQELQVELANIQQTSEFLDSL